MNISMFRKEYFHDIFPTFVNTFRYTSIQFNNSILIFLNF